MRVYFRSRSSATWSRRCRGQLRTFKVRKKHGKRRYRYFLHAQRGEKHRRRQHPDICQPTGFSPWIYRPFSLSLSLPSVSISFQTLHTWPASLSLSLDIVIAIPSTHQRRSKFLGQLLGSSIPRENFAKLYAITREEREIFSTLSQEYLRFETDSEVLPTYRYDPSHNKKKSILLLPFIPWTDAIFAGGEKYRPDPSCRLTEESEKTRVPRMDPRTDGSNS